MLQLRLLGSFEARSDGTPIALTSTRAQSLLACLALRHGTPQRRAGWRTCSGRPRPSMTGGSVGFIERHDPGPAVRSSNGNGGSCVPAASR